MLRTVRSSQWVAIRIRHMASKLGGIMDTKALEEEFGFDPAADGGLDELHSSLHPEWPEYTGQGHAGLAVGEQVTVGAGYGKSMLAEVDCAGLELRVAGALEAGCTTLSTADEQLTNATMRGATQEERAQLKMWAHLERYGSSSKLHTC